MADPIEEDGIKRRSLIKKYEQYQDHLDEMAASDKKLGKMKGKSIKQIAPEKSLLGKTDFFNKPS